MAFYYDNRHGDILFSEYEFPGHELQFPPQTRPAAAEWALGSRLVNDWPNIYGDFYEYFKAKGDNMNDPLWKRDEMKEVRAARDRGDRSDRSIHPQKGYWGFTRDAWGILRDCSGPGAVTRISEPLFGGSSMDPWSYEMQAGDQLYLNGYPFFYPW